MYPKWNADKLPCKLSPTNLFPWICDTACFIDGIIIDNSRHSSMYSFVLKHNGKIVIYQFLSFDLNF